MTARPQVFGVHVRRGVGDCQHKVTVVKPGEAGPSGTASEISITIVPDGGRVARSPFGSFTYSVEGRHDIADQLIKLAAKIRTDR